MLRHTLLVIWLPSPATYLFILSRYIVISRVVLCICISACISTHQTHFLSQNASLASNPAYKIKSVVFYQPLLWNLFIPSLPWVQERMSLSETGSLFIKGYFLGHTLFLYLVWHVILETMWSDNIGSCYPTLNSGLSLIC